jgi:hypothetical protein
MRGCKFPYYCDCEYYSSINHLFNLCLKYFGGIKDILELTYVPNRIQVQYSLLAEKQRAERGIKKETACCTYKTFKFNFTLHLISLNMDLLLEFRV